MESPVPRRVVQRNMFLLAAGLLCLSGMIQLAVALATLTLTHVTGIEAILGLGPALFLTSGALTALPAGRAMDRFGRMPVVRIGFAVGIVGALLVAAGARELLTLPVLIGLVLVGAANGTVILSRAAAADMVAPALRARAISLVLFGSVFGALLGPLVFSPMVDETLDSSALFRLWLLAAGIMAIGLVIAFAVRPDPQAIGRALAAGTRDTPAKPLPPPAPLREILRRPGVLLAMTAALASFGVMVAVMNLTSKIVVDHGHHAEEVFPIISVHLVGMFGLVLLVGWLIDTIGRRTVLVAGLVVIAVSCLSLIWVEGVNATMAALFGLGLGWSFGYVAATTELIDHATPLERGRLVGASDLSAGLFGAGLVLAGGAAYSEIGIETVAVVTAALALAPVVGILLSRRPLELAPATD